jgi:uncharacterized phage protein gp47/JayE
MSTECDCCTGISTETPQGIDNRAGLPAIAYRTGDYGTFLSSMLARIGSTTAHGLRTRSPDDFSIAFIDSCAVVADVLTFYDERIANENYLRTATELMSIGELARLTGYALRPGASASAYLAFRLNDPAANADATSPGAGVAALAALSSALGVTIPAGTKVQSLPGPGQLPQLFETSVDLDARWIDNALKPLRARPYPSGQANIDRIFLPNRGNGRGVGDRLLLKDDLFGTSLRTVVSIDIDAASAIATVLLDSGNATAMAALPSPATVPAPNGDFSDELVGKIVDKQVWDRADLATLIARRGWSTEAFEATVNAARQSTPAGTLLSAFAVRTAALFGANAPQWNALPPSMRYVGTAPDDDPVPYEEDWDTNNTLGSYSLSSYYNDNTVDLDNAYSSIAPGVTLVFVDGTTVITAVVAKVRTVSRSLYAISARVSNVSLTDYFGDLGSLHPRTAEVYVQDAQLALAPMQVTGEIGGTSVLLDRCALRVAAGGHVAVSGERDDHNGRTSVEIAEVAKATLEDGYTRLTFSQPLAGDYKIGTVFFNANVVAASNGETVTEVLGSGNASIALQSFTLKQMPLTWTSAPVAGGIDAAITVRVDGVAWKRVPYLYGAAPTDRVYALTRDKSGATVVQFGDGATYGARLPTGTENVTAVYRRGIGSAGLVAPDQLSMLVTRPPGVRDVTNPLAANGADDPETVAQSRVNAPIAVRTLDRIVTLEDYSDFVRASAGIAKARVDNTWRGPQRVIIVTVAGPAGAPVVEDSPQSDALMTEMQGAAQADYPVALKSYRPRSFSVSASLVTNPDYVADVVPAAVRAALWTAFSFEAREFGQPVFHSEVIAAIQRVPGVIAATLTSFCYTETVPATLESRLDAQPAALSGNDALGAELLTIDPIPAVLTVLT